MRVSSSALPSIDPPLTLALIPVVRSADSAAAYKMAVLLSDAPGLCVGPAGEELFAPRLLQVGSRRSAPKARISMFDVVEAKLQAAALPKPKAAAPAVAAAAARPQPAFFVARAAFD